VPDSSSPIAPLTLWGEIWRYALAIAIGALVVAGAAVQPTHPWWSLPVDVVGGLLGLVLVHWRRRFPVAIAMTLAVGSILILSLSGPSLLALVSVATRRRWREIILVGLTNIAAGMTLGAITGTSRTGDEVLIDLASNTGFTALAVAWGLYVGSRRELLRTLVERAETAESEQAAQIERARNAERARIAREMHDVLAHRISMVSLHAGALAYRTDLSPDEIRRSAAIIQSSSHDALVELRQVLGILRDASGDDQPERPQPTAGDLAALLDEARGAGMRIEARMEADLAQIPDAIGRTAYRVVQESLTNARKHAPDTAVRVEVRTDEEDALIVRVSNPLPVGAATRVRSPSSGLGLIGLAERVRLVGGDLTHELGVDGRFTVTARLP